MNEDTKPINVTRRGVRFELAGMLLVLLSMGGCAASLAADVPGAVYAVGGMFGGLLVFLYGRFC